MKTHFLETLLINDDGKIIKISIKNNSNNNLFKKKKKTLKS